MILYTDLHEVGLCENSRPTSFTNHRPFAIQLTKFEINTGIEETCVYY